MRVGAHLLDHPGGYLGRVHVGLHVVENLPLAELLLLELPMLVVACKCVVVFHYGDGAEHVAPQGGAPWGSFEVLTDMLLEKVEEGCHSKPQKTPISRVGVEFSGVWFAPSTITITLPNTDKTR